MKQFKRIGIVIAGVVIIAGIVWGLCGKKIKMLYTSLNSFKDENLAHTFQHTPEIQPTKKISAGNKTFQFLKEDNAALADGFFYEDIFYSTERFIENSKTTAMIVIKEDVIKYETYFMGGDENTLFSSNSMGKSFVSALMGIAVAEGSVSSIDDTLGTYIPEFVGTELENIPIRACLQMASGIDFNEDTDMNQFSMRTLMGKPAMKVIAKYGVQEPPYTYGNIQRKTKARYVEVLKFWHFVEIGSINGNDHFDRHKTVYNKIPVSVVLDLGVGKTNKNKYTTT